MAVLDYKPTRSQLLQVKKTRATAERGHRLLKLKRDALIVEFFKVSLVDFYLGNIAVRSPFNTNFYVRCGFWKDSAPLYSNPVSVQP